MVRRMDTLLEQLVEASRATLRSVLVKGVGRPELWESFVNKFGASVEPLTMPWQPYEPAVHRAIDSTYHRWTNLRSIELCLGPTTEYQIRGALTHVTPLQGLASIPNLEDVALRLEQSSKH